MLYVYACMMAISATHMSDLGQEVTIVQDGKPMAKIVVGQKADTQVIEAAKTLNYYIEQASGAKLEVITDNEVADYRRVTVQVGKNVLPLNNGIITAEIDDDGFVIYVGSNARLRPSAKDNDVIICGPTPWGTEFGVYEFLERYAGSNARLRLSVGVRWLLPGPDGDDVPIMRTIAVPQGIVKEEPAAFSRLFSGLRGSWQNKWARFNRMHGRVRFHHNLLNLFPAETYTKTHPEFFPMKDGKTRFLPPTNNTHGWQPCFSAPESVEEAVKNIIQYFNEHPQEMSYSLGYLADVKEEDIFTSRHLLETCIDKCKTDKQKARAKLLEKAFQYYEASALAFLADKQVEAVPINTETEALHVLTRAERAMQMAQKRRDLAFEIYPKDPVLLNPLNIDRYLALAGENWGVKGIWAVMDWVSKDDNAVRKKVEELTQESDCDSVRCQTKLMLDIADGKIKTTSRNPSFEEGEGTETASWTYWVKPDPHTGKTVGRMLRTEDQAHTGKASLLCDSMYRGGPVQSIMDFQEGKYSGLAWVYIPEGQISRGTTELSVTPRDKQGDNLPGFSTKIVPQPGKWTLIVAVGEIPKEIKGKEVHHVMIIPIVDGFQDGGKVYWDDVALYKVKDN